MPASARPRVLGACLRNASEPVPTPGAYSPKGWGCRRAGPDDGTDGPGVVAARHPGPGVDVRQDLTKRRQFIRGKHYPPGPQHRHTTPPGGLHARRNRPVSTPWPNRLIRACGESQATYTVRRGIPGCAALPRPDRIGALRALVGDIRTPTSPIPITQFMATSRIRVPRRLRRCRVLLGSAGG